MPNNDGTLQIHEIIENTQVKPLAVVNLTQDDVEAARQAARNARNKTNREVFRAIDKQLAAGTPVDGDGELVQPGLVKTEDYEVMEPEQTPVDDIAVAMQNTPEVNVQAPPDVSEIDLTPKVKIKGKEYTLQQIVDGFGKVENADEYYNQAARKLYEANAKPAPAFQPVFKPEDDAALVKAIQEGTPEEAAAALNKFRQQSAQIAQQSYVQERARLDAQATFNKVLAENKDIADDAQLRQLACSRDADLHKDSKIYDPTDTNNNFYLRFTDACKQIREWDAKRKGTAVAVDKRQQLIKKKESLKTLNSSASERVASNPPNNGPKIFGSRDDDQAVANYNQHVANALRAGRRKVTFIKD